MVLALSEGYVLIAILALVVVLLLVFFASGRRRGARISSLAALAFGFIIAGIAFGEDQILGYALIGIGVALAIADLFVPRPLKAS